MSIISLSNLRIIDKPEEIEAAFEDCLQKNLEGLMAKRLLGTYQAGARGWNWIKYKKSYSSKINDTIDAVVMGYDYGLGKRTSFGIGGFLIGVYDRVSDTFKTIAKIGTGLTDEEWKTLEVKSQKSKVKIKPKNYDVNKLMECNVWVNPEMVVEIKADEITKSPVHTAGTNSKLKTQNSKLGYALRFPRLVSFRTDKKAEDSTTLEEIEKMYEGQKYPK